MKCLTGKYKEILRYLIVGVLTTVVSLGTYFICVHTFLRPDVAWELQLANIISWIAAVVFAYVANRIYVFESKNADVLKEIVMFFSARVGSLLMDMGIMFVAVTIMGIDDTIAKLAVQVVVTVANYILSKLFVFRKE